MRYALSKLLFEKKKNNALHYIEVTFQRKFGHLFLYLLNADILVVAAPSTILLLFLKPSTLCSTEKGISPI
jgi:hypothetical protein